MAKNRRHVVPHKSGWAVKAPNSSRASSTHKTQAAAERRAKEILARIGGGEATIHDVKGRIRDSDTVAPGNDPSPPKDRKH